VSSLRWTLEQSSYVENYFIISCMNAFLEGSFHVDTWHLTWFDAYFWLRIPFMSIIWCILLLFLDEGELSWTWSTMD
jgi:hypothetical protein